MRRNFALGPRLKRSIFLLCVFGIAAGAAQAQVRVTVNETPIIFEGQPPVERGGRILVPLRGVLERLGAYVRYDSQTKTVTALRDATNITLPVGSRRALVGDRAVTLDTPAFIEGGSVLVPLRFVAEALGAQVTWDVGTRTVAIATEGRTPMRPSPRPVDVATTGIVTAVYPGLSPKRLVVRVPGAGSASSRERTIPLGPTAVVSVRRPNSLLAITLDRVRVGDTVEVRQTTEGVATAVEVVSRAPRTEDQRPPLPNRLPPSGSNAAAATFKGEFLEGNRIPAGRWVLKMTDGRLIEVPESVAVLYGQDKIGLGDLRSGDQLTIAVDPKTRRGTRIVVAVER